ncbi:MAG: hypothetical protein HZY75_11105 [Nocardioidaceae bacterium]|nr:MAG: hypothetical protein HZY75_11105 [Nocardioidaceae bacterium]
MGVQGQARSLRSHRRLGWGGTGDCEEFDAGTNPSNPADDGKPGKKDCEDGVDNDGDGFADFPADYGCASATDSSELGTTQCDNGIDDDGDGKIDYRPDGTGDPNCHSVVDDDERAESCVVTGVEDRHYTVMDADAAVRRSCPMSIWGPCRFPVGKAFKPLEKAIGKHASKLDPLAKKLRIYEEKVRKAAKKVEGATARAADAEKN